VIRFGVISGLILLVAACAKTRPKRTPEEITAKYFTALGSGDCAELPRPAAEISRTKLPTRGVPAASQKQKNTARRRVAIVDHAFLFPSARNSRRRVAVGSRHRRNIVAPTKRAVFFCFCDAAGTPRVAISFARFPPLVA